MPQAELGRAKIFSTVAIILRCNTFFFVFFAFLLNKHDGNNKNKEITQHVFRAPKIMIVSTLVKQEIFRYFKKR